jgi:hypothetical protein
MLPTQIDAQALPPPPGVIGSLRAGFDAIASHIGLILMPLGLDLLLWLGPRLSVSQIVQPMLEDMARLAPGSGLPQADVNSTFAVYSEALNRLNLLAFLRTFPIGLSSLMSGRMPIDSPLGPQPVVQLDSVTEALGLLFLLVIVGWALGGLYFHSVAGLVGNGSLSTSHVSLGRAVVQTILYSLICAVLLWFLGLPALFVVYVSFAINSVLGQVMLLLLGFLSLWLLVPLFFSPHGIYLTGQTAFGSFLAGFRLARFTLPTSSLFVMTVFLVGLGLNTLWVVPAENTWIALVGVMGHAFITTALLASSFVYFHNMSTWVQSVLARLRAGMPTQTA